MAKSSGVDNTLHTGVHEGLAFLGGRVASQSRWQKMCGVFTQHYGEYISSSQACSPVTVMSFEICVNCKNNLTAAMAFR